MTISEIITKGRVVSEVSMVRKVSCVNVGFLNLDRVKDETQLTVEKQILTKAGTQELEDLFNSLATELNTTKNDVTYITIVASANSVEELEAMGY